MATTTPKKTTERNRTENWTKEGIVIVTEECVKNSSVLHGAIGPFITAERKGKIWREITEKVNAHCGSHRTVEQVKKKWKNIRSKAVSNVRDFSNLSKKTGNSYFFVSFCFSCFKTMQ